MPYFIPKGFSILMYEFLLKWLQPFVLIAIVLLLMPLIGRLWSLLVYGNRTILHPFLEWLETATYRVTGINPQEEMTWEQYAKNVILFNVCGAVILFLILVFQAYLPWNPQQFTGIPWTSAINTAISFMTNTDWQSYPGETTLSYGSQMLGLTTQNFLSAATGSAVLMAFIRGLTKKSPGTIGNFWCDLVRSIVYLLLPLAILLSLLLVGQGVVQTLSPYYLVETLDSGSQVIPTGPVASQAAIKIIGTNGGGFFNANSAHPFENPTPLSNFLQIIFILALPASMVYAYGLLIRSMRHAWLILGVMCVIWLGGLILASYSDSLENPVLNEQPVWEGKEVRFSPLSSLLWATATTVTSNGSVNMMHESLSPLAGGVVLFNMMLGEVSFGGIGVGLCSMIMFILLTVFLCGLMVGRTPEYKGKKLNKQDIQWIVCAILTPNILILLGAGVASVLPIAQASLSTFGPHGLTELLYAFTSAAANNGSSFAGLNANTPFFNLVLAGVMLLARLVVVVASLALAGSFANKKAVPISIGTLSTDNLLFAILLLSTILIIGGLSFLPALSLGPIVEHLLMLQGQAFPFTGDS